jgi:hypothetical protein
MSLWEQTEIGKSQVNPGLSMLRIAYRVMRSVTRLLSYRTIHSFLLNNLISVHESVARFSRSFPHLDVLHKTLIQVLVCRSLFVLGVLLVIDTDRNMPIMNDNARKDGFFLYLTRFNHRKIVDKFS